MFTDKDKGQKYKLTINLDDKSDPRTMTVDYVTENAVVLDVGCACGDLGVALKQSKNAKMYGLEYNSESVQIAMATGAYQNVTQFNLDALTMADFPQYQNKFDYIICNDILEHLRNPIWVLNILKSYLKEGGYFIASIPNVAHMSIKANLLVDDFSYTPLGLLDETHIHLFTFRSIAVGLSSINLQIEDCQYTSQNKTGWQPYDPYPLLPMAVKAFLFRDWHSYVCQYVMKISISNDSGACILRNNFEKININENNAPDYIRNYRQQLLTELQNSV